MADYLALPDEVVAETILWRLPVKSIMQCRCVCKSWYSLITSPDFISTHLLRKTLTLNPQIFLKQRYYTAEIGTCLLLFDNQQYLRSMSLQLTHPPPYPNCWMNIVGSVNGLICFYIGRANRVINFILCNPSIRHFQSIPPPHSSVIDWNVEGFGFDERTQDYKILLIIPDKTGFIYSLNSNCWRVITSPVPESSLTRFNLAVFVNGQFHWLACPKNLAFRYYFIMVFDLKDETFGQVSLPECLANSRGDISSIRITEFGESSIAVIQRTCIMHQRDEFENQIWVMKEYGSEESWMKLATVTLRICEVVLGFRNKNEVLIRRRSRSGCITSQKINSDNLELGEAKKMMDADKRPSLQFSVHKYVPSLVLLDKQNNVDVTLTPLEETAEI